MTDIEIASSVKLQRIEDVAKKLGLSASQIIQYGEHKAKIKEVKQGKKKGKLILVTAINPTKAGIGKTTVSIGLADALAKRGESVCLALREPSLGPVFGSKGGATGGGQSQVVPMEDINLHFNGDFHAITSANNLLCSAVENHIYFGNELGVDETTIVFRRCIDLNERGLREIELSVPCRRKERFVITAASEIMAILCLSKNLEDLKNRLGNIYVCNDKKGKPLFAKDFGVHNAMTILLKDALMPNLVQTLCGTPAIIHGGPFANIAHGCNSVIATKTALSLADFCITEAGFGADLGAEKFLDFKCRLAKLNPDCVVLVATIKALKLHGGVEEAMLENENVDAVKLGVANLVHHTEVIQKVFGLPLVVTLNRFQSDTEKEIKAVKDSLGAVEVVENEVYSKGADGGKQLAKAVYERCLKKSKLKYAYDLSDEFLTKLQKVVKNVYGGKGVELSATAKESLKNITKLGFQSLPIIVAKTQFSLSSDKTKIGRPKDFIVEVKDIELKSGAGFLVVVCGDIMLMPALGKKPAYLNMKIDKTGKIEGLF